jgi:hypothetical protein
VTFNKENIFVCKKFFLLYILAKLETTEYVNHALGSPFLLQINFESVISIRKSLSGFEACIN